MRPGLYHRSLWWAGASVSAGFLAVLSGWHACAGQFRSADRRGCATQWEGFNDPEGSDLWHGIILVARNPQRAWLKGKSIGLFLSAHREIPLAGLIRCGA